uniref:Coiled-coil domain-containing protein n=1 Tax=Angiostrongylus cantonensis TaxID=6313 RepID=A0A0K0CWB9_ANGCA
MGRYKRIPGKNRKKLKSVDPFNNKAVALRAEAVRKINWEPKDDNQEMTRSLKELEKSKAYVHLTKADVKRRKQCRNKVLAEAKRNGIRMGRFETVRNFVRRVERMTHMAIKDHEILIRQGLVGRKETDIATDFKLLEEKEKRRKEQSKNEIRNKIKVARRKRENDTKIKEGKLEGKIERKLKQGGMQRNEDLVEKEEETEIMAKKMKRKLGGSEKVRLKKKLASKYECSEAVLNQREVVAFGERYDAPPEYKGPLKDVMNPLMAKAGAKNLLLHSLLQQKCIPTTTYLKDTKKSKPGEIDRQRIIEAYRTLKRKRTF